MDSSFWVGILLAVPLAIISNLLTPKVQAWLAERGSTKLAKRHDKLRADYSKVKQYKDDRTALNTFLITSVLEATFIGSAIGIVAGMIFGLNFLVGLGGPFIAFGQFLAAAGAVAIVQVCLEAMRVSNRARGFAEYKARVESELGEQLDS